MFGNIRLLSELKSDVSRFTAHVQTFPAKNQVVASCENTDL